jgi:hypothetical protein
MSERHNQPVSQGERGLDMAKPQKDGKVAFDIVCGTTIHATTPRAREPRPCRSRSATRSRYLKRRSRQRVFAKECSRPFGPGCNPRYTILSILEHMLPCQLPGKGGRAPVLRMSYVSTYQLTIIARKGDDGGQQAAMDLRKGRHHARGSFSPFPKISETLNPACRGAAPVTSVTKRLRFDPSLLFLRFWLVIAVQGGSLPRVGGSLVADYRRGGKRRWR